MIYFKYFNFIFPLTLVKFLFKWKADGPSHSNKSGAAQRHPKQWKTRENSAFKWKDYNTLVYFRFNFQTLVWSFLLLCPWKNKDNILRLLDFLVPNCCWQRKKHKTNSSMAFASFLGRVLFASLFILSAYQELVFLLRYIFFLLLLLLLFFVIIIFFAS